jgi:predicted CXXCH cytochrome family protein
VSLIGILLARVRSTKDTTQTVPAAHYVGTNSCGSCHKRQLSDWQGSQHQAAMAEANDRSVKGNFNDATFTYAGITTRFSRRGGKFFVRTDGPDGRLADFEIKYTFGVDPLQQYLIAFEDGRVQALSIAWDTRPKEQGGQRWFHLYPREHIRNDDELHWTRPAQNWNNMCADCHSTALRKNYDAASNQFHTRWAEISVGCEACHGPGSRHVAWAATRSRSDSTLGLTASLTERRGVTWTVSATSGNATRSTPRPTDREIETCAQCHSRRSQIADGYEAGKPIFDYYRPAFLTRPTYYPDGQQRDEVYTWGSFVQSRMYARGVTCSDCHNPHTGKVRASGNALCASCHLADKYDTPEHHHHTQASAGASCVSCHMPASTYMVVDPRHDHSLRIPRPDLSVALGTPNACTNCHANRDARWAARYVRVWYGRESHGYQRFAQSFASADAGAADAQSLLTILAGDDSQPAIARATALAELTGASSPEAFAVIATSVRDASPIVRLAALQSLESMPPQQRVQLIMPLLADSTRTVRIVAARLLAGVPPSFMSLEQRAAFQRASAEFVDAQRQNADRAESRANLGTFLAQLGDMVSGETELKSAIRLDARFIPAYVNLADLYRGVGRDADGERLLRDGLTRTPGSAVLHYALGLVLTRLNRSDSALHEFDRAASLDPQNARFAYVHAVALHSAGKVDAAIAKLQSVLTLHPGDGDVLNALVNFARARGDTALAERYAAQLRVVSGSRR